MTQSFPGKTVAKAFQEDKTSLDRNFDELLRLVQIQLTRPNSIDGRILIPDSVSPVKLVSSAFSPLPPGADLTIASGIITIPRPVFGNRAIHRILPQSGITDNIGIINGGIEGLELILQSKTVGDTITISQETDIRLSANGLLDTIYDTIRLLFHGGVWNELSRSSNT